MDYSTRLAIRAVISGLRYSRRIDAKDCEAIVAAIDEAGTTALHKVQRNAAGELDALAAEVALDSFGANHPIYLAAKQKSETD